MNKVSVIVPVYNVEKFLSKCVDSLIMQTYDNLEIILVDDGSTDKCPQICDDYKRKDSRITVIHKKNGGLSDARNYGLKKSSGDYIMFIDSDDWIDSDTISILVDNFKDNNIDIICYGMTIEYSDGRTYTKKISKEEVLSNESAIIALNTFKNMNVSACNKIFRKTIFSNIEFPYGKYCEDYYVMYKLFYKSKKIKVLPINKYHYYQRVGSISKDSQIKYDYIYASKEQMEFLNDCNKKLSNIGKIAYSFANLTIYNAHLKRKNMSGVNKLIKEASKYRRLVYFEKDIPLIKKIQFLLFIRFTYLYNILFKMKKDW